METLKWEKITVSVSSEIHYVGEIISMYGGKFSLEYKLVIQIYVNLSRDDSPESSRDGVSFPWSVGMELGTSLFSLSPLPFYLFFSPECLASGRSQSPLVCHLSSFCPDDVSEVSPNFNLSPDNFIDFCECLNRLSRVEQWGPG